MKIINFLKKLRRKLLSLTKKREFLAEGLTRVPSVQVSAISDLFIWRKTSEWKTYFELLDINTLINADNEDSGKNSATFVFYDSAGIEIGREKVSVNPGRQTIDINSLIPGGYEGFGTYACFHDSIPKAILDSGSFIAERGYSGYQWKDLGARAYVHGNLDAIAKSDKGIEMLGTSWKSELSYNLQHELTGPATYEFALVNPTRSTQKVEFIIKNPLDGTEIKELAHIGSRASVIKHVQVKAGEKFQLAIRSKLYMARPVVFRLQTSSMDVFHG
jgi:hypothetical protein